MNARILELIKNPEIIQNQDLDLLNSEVKKHPYLQSIRALQLIGNHQFNYDNYQKELSLTAAYTTDKKILYQLINKKKIEEVIAEEEVIIPEEKIISESVKIEEEISIPKLIGEAKFVPKEIAKPVYVEGVLNRILFKGEEDFLERETENIDLESTLESGKIVTHKLIEKIESVEKITKKVIVNETIETEKFSPETIINETKISEQKTTIEDTSQISFHGSEDFFPEVKIQPSESEPSKYEIPKPKLSKQEEEMQRLIAEVAAKVKASKKEIVKETEVVENSDVNFSDTQELKIELSKTEEKIIELSIKEENSEIEIPAKKAENIKNIEEFNQKTPETKEIRTESENSSWKPMQIFTSSPDSLMVTKTEEKNTETSIEKTENKKIIEPISPQKEEERPAFNVSFFTPQVSTIESEKEKNLVEEVSKLSENSIDNSNSNVPNFINTWQNWLKIERKEAIIEEKPLMSKEEVKNSVIEKFIEKEPKISKLKEDSDFVVKEKGSNISHLMTETLANLYVEQKLYAKAIKGYEILIEKHPQKEILFQEKIQEIKDLRKNN